MAIKRTFNGATIIKPGAYSKIVVENLTGFPLQPTGTVGIIGEAAGGESGVLDILSRDGIQEAKTRYKSGPIADALDLISNPSNDTRIPNGASKIIVYKTNKSTRSFKILKNGSGDDFIKLTSKNWGSDENTLSVSVSVGSVADSNASIAGSVSGPFTMVSGQTLILNVAGQAYTFTSALSGSQTAAALVIELETAASWGGVKPVKASVVAGTQRIRIELDTVVLPAASLGYGYIKVDPSCTLDTVLGIIGESRGSGGSRVFTFKKDLVEETSLDIGGADQISIKYVGTGASAKISIGVVSGQLKLTSTVVGGIPSDTLDVVLSDVDGKNKHTIKTLSELIASNVSYESVLISSSTQTSASQLDHCVDLDVGIVAGLRRDSYAFASYISTFSLLAGAEVLDASGTLAVVGSQELFSGGSDGVSSNSDFASGFEAFKEERINCIVPLISRDTGALTIDSINALAVAHCQWGWSTVGRSERHAFVSIFASKKEYTSAAKSLNSGYASMTGQQVRVLNKTGDFVWLDPWATACLAAGMRAGAEVGEPITFKIVNVNDARVYDGSWNPKKDYGEMIESGCLILEALDSGGGFRWVVGNTTYGIDGSFVWNRESVVQAAGVLSYDLRLNLESQFTGRKARSGTAEAIANFIKNRMSAYISDEIIVGDDLNEGLGYKNLSVFIQGSTAAINVSVTPVQGIDFILPTIYLSDISQSAK